MRAWWLAGLVLLIVFGTGLSSTQTASASDCLEWDIAQYHGRPTIDRLSSGESYGQLLRDWKADNCLRMNEVQALGTHNSYHLQPLAYVLAALQVYNPAAAPTFVYNHRPLAEQFSSLGVRQVELDVFADTNGGLFANPLGPFYLGLPDPQSGLGAPGLKVLHIQDIDYRTTCKTFKDCLQAVKTWSDANPGHIPIMVLVEAKDDPLAVTGLPPFTSPVAFNATQLNGIDAEIREVFGADQLITPDDVRGKRATLEEAVLKDGWPTLNETRGRVFFALDNEDAKRDLYLAGHPSLQGRVMFTSSGTGHPESAFLKLNDPVGQFAEIQAAVAAGYMVRTRADENTIEARYGLTGRRTAAIASGAQFISTDYPEPSQLFPSTYSVSIPGGDPARCNPVFAPPGCNATKIEDIDP